MRSRSTRDQSRVPAGRRHSLAEIRPDDGCPPRHHCRTRPGNGDGRIRQPAVPYRGNALGGAMLFRSWSSSCSLCGRADRPVWLAGSAHGRHARGVLHRHVLSRGRGAGRRAVGRRAVRSDHPHLRHFRGRVEASRPSGRHTDACGHGRVPVRILLPCARPCDLRFIPARHPLYMAPAQTRPCCSCSSACRGGTVRLQRVALATRGSGSTDRRCPLWSRSWVRRADLADQGPVHSAVPVRFPPPSCPRTRSYSGSRRGS